MDQISLTYIYRIKWTVSRALSLSHIHKHTTANWYWCKNAIWIETQFSFWFCGPLNAWALLFTWQCIDILFVRICGRNETRVFCEDLWILILPYLSRKCLVWHALHRFIDNSVQFWSYCLLFFFFPEFSTVYLLSP